MLIAQVKYSQCISRFDKIEGHVRALEKKPKQCQVLCRKIHKEFDQLQKVINDLLQKYTLFHQKLRTEIVEVEEKSNKIYTQLQTETKKMRECTVEVASLESTIKDFSQGIQEMEGSIVSVRRQVEKEQEVRFDASHEWIPGVAFFKGLVTGNAEKIGMGLIPGYNIYQAVRGIVSHIAQEKERLEGTLHSKIDSKKNLENQKNQTDNKLKQKQIAIQNLSSKIDQFSQYHELLEKKDKLLGKRITDLADINKNLKMTSEKYSFLKTEVDLFSLFIEMDTIQQEIPHFISKCREVKTSLTSMKKFQISDVDVLDKQLTQCKKTLMFEEEN